MALHNLVTHVHTPDTDARLASFVDSRGQPVPRWPDVVLPSTCVLVTRQHHGQTEILVHQRADNKHWGFLGGAMEPGESLEACAIREVYEESGLHITLSALLCVDADPTQGAINVYPDGGIVHYCCVSFTAVLDRAYPTDLWRSAESLVLRWCRLDRLPSPFLPLHRQRLNAFLQQRSPLA